MTSLRKTISILLAVIMVCSAFGVMPLTASANDGQKSNPLITDVIADTENTNTYYFYMPEQWRNDYNDNSTNIEDACAGIYWWEGTDNCNEHPNAVTDKGWPGYRVTEQDSENVFVANVPKDVKTIIWNNTVDSGEDSTTPEYTAAVQTANIPSKCFAPKDIKDAYGVFPDGKDSFDGMIFVCDPGNISVNEFSGKVTYNGSWFYYYGNGEYGVAPTKEAAGEEVYANGVFPQLGFSIDKEEMYVVNGETDTIAMKNYDEKTVFSIVEATEAPTEAQITCEISVDDPAVASVSVKDGVVTVKGLKDGSATVKFNYTIPGETDPETGNIISSATTISKICKVQVFTPPEDEPGATEDEAKYDYSLNGTGTVTVEANSTSKYIKFVPEESATYRIFSQCNEDVEATLYDSEWELLEYDDDDGDSLNFMIKQDLEEGQTYYLKVNTVDFHGEGDYVDCDVVFGFESDYDDNDPATEDEAQNNDYESYDYEINGEGTVAVSTNRIYRYIKFVPDENQSYEIYSDSDGYDTYAVLLDENGEEIADDDDSYDGDNFRIAAFLKAGKTYYVGVRRYSGSDFIDYNVTFKKTPDTPAGWLYENEIVTIGDFKYRLYFERYMVDEGDYSKCYCAELIGYNGNEENVEVPESFEYDNRTVYVSSIGNYIFASNPNAGKIKTLKAPDGITYISAYALFDSEGGKRLDINLECGEYTELEEYYYDDDEFGFAVNAKYATLYGYYGSSTDIVIPAMVQGVPVKVVYDFINNEHKANVKSVTVPDTVEWISGTAFRLECYDEDLDRYSTIKSDIKVIGGENAAFGPYLFIDENDFEFYIQDNSATFIGYFGELTEIVIPSTAEGVPVEDITYDVITGKVTSVTIPDSVKYIDYHAFYVYDEENDEYFPSKATIIGGENALVYNYSEYNEDGIRFYIGRDGEAVVVGYYGFNPTLNIPDTFKGLPVTAVDYLDSGYNVNFVKNVIVPSSVKYISEYSFADFSNLESVTLPCDLENTFFYVWNSADEKNVKMENIIKSHTEVTDEAVAPTTTKTGLTEGSHCSVCGTVITPQQVVPKLTSLSLEKSSATVYVKGTTQINAKVANSNAKTTYTSSDTKVATVSASGKVTAKKAGKATITVTNNGVSKKFTVEVKNPKLSKKTVTVKKNKTVKVKITGKIKGINNKYTNTKFAKITSKKSASTLTIKGLKKGNTTLKINVSGITLRLKVKVKAK
ncbi:MAG: Ig-like domain-containing protein [Ruminococcus sp.]